MSFLFFDPEIEFLSHFLDAFYAFDHDSENADSMCMEFLDLIRRMQEDNCVIDSISSLVCEDGDLEFLRDCAISYLKEMDRVPAKRICLAMAQKSLIRLEELLCAQPDAVRKKYYHTDNQQEKSL